MWGIAITWRPSSTLKQLGHLCKVLYKVSPFRSVPPTNMAAKGNSCFWLANVKKIFSSETAWPNGAKLGRKHLSKILYKTSSFGSIRPTNMATKINSFFWLANVIKIFSSETAWPNGAKLGRKHLCKVQTWHRWSLGVTLSKLCPTAPPSIQYGCCF